MNSAFIAQRELIMNAGCKDSVALNISALILFMECKNLIVFRFLIQFLLVFLLYYCQLKCLKRSMYGIWAD